MDSLVEHNQESSVALKSRNEDIKALKTRIVRLETDKKDVEDELKFVTVKVSRMEKDIKELNEAKVAREE